MVTPLFRQLAFPSTTAVRYSGYWLQTQHVELASITAQVILAAISRHTDCKERTFKSARILRYHHGFAEAHFAMEAWPTVRSVDDLNNDFTGLWKPGTLSITFCNFPELIPDILHAFASTFPLSDVQALAIVGVGDTTFHTFWPDLTRLRSVTDFSIAFARPTLCFLQNAAAPVHPPNDLQRDPAILFPELQTLTVLAARWGRHYFPSEQRDEEEGEREGRHDSDSEDSRTLAPQLRDALLQRKGQGSPVRKLRVPWAIDGIPRGDLEELKALGAVDIVEYHESEENLVYAAQIEALEKGWYGLYEEL